MVPPRIAPAHVARNRAAPTLINPIHSDIITMPVVLDQFTGRSKATPSQCSLPTEATRACSPPKHVTHPSPSQTQNHPPSRPLQTMGATAPPSCSVWCMDWGPACRPARPAGLRSETARIQTAARSPALLARRPRVVLVTPSSASHRRNCTKRCAL